MADYININGNNIPIRASDPTNPITGEIWYNTTSNSLKGQGVTTVGSWATGGSLNTARNSINNGSVIGTQTAGVAAGGVTVPVARTNNTEEYNGSAWTNVNPMNNTLSSRGTAGTQTAGLASGGLPNPVAVANSEEYNGTSWTNGNAMNNARGYGHVQTGTQDAAMAAGGYNPPVTFVTATEFYDGTSWTNQVATIQPHYAGGSAGNQTSAWYVGAGGVSPAPANKLTYNWDGTSWTASNPYNDTSKVNFFSAGPPGGTTGYIAGGDYDPGVSTNTEEYDGTSWTNSPANMNTGRSVGGNCGNLSAGLAVGGNIPPRVATTEEWTGPGVPTTVTFSSS